MKYWLLAAFYSLTILICLGMFIYIMSCFINAEWMSINPFTYTSGQRGGFIGWCLMFGFITTLCGMQLSSLNEEKG